MRGVRKGWLELIVIIEKIEEGAIPNTVLNVYDHWESSSVSHVSCSLNI